MPERKENKSIDFFKLIFINAPFGVYTLNKDGIIDSFNPKMVELAGSKSADEVIGLDVFSMDSYKNSGLDVFFRQGLKGKSFETEVKYISQTGHKETWRCYRGVPLFSVNSAVQGLLLIVEDITERKAMQEELKKYTAQLEVEIEKRTGKLMSLEKQYEVVVENSLVGMTILQDGIFKYVNLTFVKMFGYDKIEELIGESWQKVIYKEDIPIVEATGLKERMKGSGDKKVYIVRGIKKNGEIIYLEISSSPAVFDGKPAAAGSLEDITERINSEKKEREHFAEIEKMNKFMMDRENKMIELKKRIEELENSCKNN